MTTKKAVTKKPKKPPTRICFLPYPDWKAWSAMAPDQCFECYGDYVTAVFIDSVITKNSILVVFDAKKFGDYIRNNNLDFEADNMPKNRADWVAQLPEEEIVEPHKSNSPYLERPTATFSEYGHVFKEIVYYLMVAIHWKDDVRDHHQFIAEELGGYEGMIACAFLYLSGFGVKLIYDSHEVLEPVMCPCCGEADFEIYHDPLWGELKVPKHNIEDSDGFIDTYDEDDD